MPKTLLLLRHADTLPAGPGENDHARALSDTGRAECVQVADWLREQRVYMPQLTLCSTAKRTQETAQRIEDAGDLNLEQQPCDRLYLASAGDILYLIQQVSEPSCDRLMIVGHNPGLHHLAQLLAKDGEPAALERLARDFPPASLAVFDMPIVHWGDIALHSGALKVLR